MLLADAAILLIAVIGVQAATETHLLATPALADVSNSWRWILAGLLLVGWMATTAVAGAYDSRLLGSGSEEYRRLIRAAVEMTAVVAFLAFLFRLEVARSFLALSVPLGVIMLVLARVGWRRYLLVQRSSGRLCSTALLVGSRDAVGEVATQLSRSEVSGFTVVGACVPGGVAGDEVEGTGTPIVGDVADAVQALGRVGASTVIIASTDSLSPTKVREISWALEPGRQHLVVAPSLIDVSGPRILTRPVAGLPLMHVETPRMTLGRRIGKRTLDIVGAGVLLAVASPIMLVVALMIRMTSNGPALFRQERIGKGGHPFTIFKFRTMRQGADAELATLLAAQGSDGTPLFKVTDDPRITPVGRLLRKTSLDELPQLFNVLAGTMSLVGPRPQVAREVAMYTSAATRRLLVQPGVTGSWQVSGRSNLSWEEAMRLDLYYVENWSLVGDLVILVRTVRAVLAREGAH
ncbi:polyprenyl glycosylphosphotransferase [Branchiibius sp. NY16-3462-2]|nr:polyprenyl glycosylphosphotransferase [Branchiibius sp. NY16-3462-2]